MPTDAVPQIASFGLTSSDAGQLTEFYAAAFGARLISSERLGGTPFEQCFGVSGGAWRHALALGDGTIDLLQFDIPGRAYPRPLSPYDTTFQHFALVVSDMHLALAQLKQVPGWRPISRGGPQRLPKRSGGVEAFKFQDPDGHPLELLAFPEHSVPPYWRERSAHGIFLGIDHSAISVRDTSLSTAFYEALGFLVTAQISNHGEAQAHLDGISRPQVEVTALSLAVSTPHLELLCYRSEAPPPRQTWASNDVAATRMALVADDPLHVRVAAQRLIIDPDGHRVLLPS